MINKQCPPWVAKKRNFQKGVAHAIDNIFLEDVKETKGVYQGRESVVINNLSMIFDKCRTKDMTAETYVDKKLVLMGYKVIDCRQYGQGHPDYIAIKGKTRVYVEVKSTGDGLSMSQGSWIMKNPDKKVIIFWVEN